MFFAGTLEEHLQGEKYIFRYAAKYLGEPVSLTMPLRDDPYVFGCFPTYFDGVLPEGAMLDGLLQGSKIDRNDLFSQLCAVGADLVGAVTVTEDQ